jgi:hypothetical protein
MAMSLITYKNNKIMKNNKFPLIAESTANGMVVCFTDENTGVVIELSRQGGWKKGEVYGQFLSCFSESRWKAIALPQSIAEASKVKSQIPLDEKINENKDGFPLIAEGKLSGRVVCFTSETSGVVIVPASNETAGCIRSGTLNSCFKKSYWKIISSLQPVSENKDELPLLMKGKLTGVVICFTDSYSGVVIVPDRNKIYVEGELIKLSLRPDKFEIINKNLTFPLVAKSIESNFTVCFTDMTTGIVVRQHPNISFLPVGCKVGGLNQCLDESKWKIITSQKTKKFEVEVCECGKEVPVQLMIISENGSRICPECRIEQLNKIIDNVRVEVNN